MSKAVVKGTTWVDGQEYLGKNVITSSAGKFHYERSGISFNCVADFASYLKLPMSAIRRILDKGYSADKIWEFAVGELPDDEFIIMAKDINFKFCVKVDVSKLGGHIPPYRVFISKGDFARYFKIPFDVLCFRLEDNWSMQDIISIPVDDTEFKTARARAVERLQKKHKLKYDAFPIKYRGREFKSISQISRYFGFNYKLFKMSEIAGMSEDEFNVWIENRVARRHPNIEPER